jgi:hypothetical protein
MRDLKLKRLQEIAGNIQPAEGVKHPPGLGAARSGAPGYVGMRGEEVRQQLPGGGAESAPADLVNAPAERAAGGREDQLGGGGFMGALQERGTHA